MKLNDLLRLIPIGQFVRVCTEQKDLVEGYWDGETISGSTTDDKTVECILGGTDEMILIYVKD